MRIGFVGNHTSRLADGTSTHLAILHTQGMKLDRLFSPEHGAFGLLDHDGIPDETCPASGLPIYSLYGDTRKPTPEMLDGLQALVFEIQDVGARFYTYASTLLLCLEACVERGIKLIVLDRPNPITGTHVEGPLPDSDKSSFTCCHNIPIRHGLTLGELARLAAIERGFETNLTVIPCEGWIRNMWWDETGLPWINPSPAMRSLDTAIVYPGICLLEQTNVSVGRGTATPFLMFGAPWIIGIRIAHFINTHMMPNLHAVETQFTPHYGVYSGVLCHGVRLHITNRNAINSVKLGLLICSALHKFWPQKFNSEGINKLLANDSVLSKVLSDPSESDYQEMVCVSGYADRTRNIKLYSATLHEPTIQKTQFDSV
jgi:uncharacterized protein YbbC (DUF1343 family)